MRRLIPGAMQNGQSGILGKCRVTGGELTHVENRTAIGLDLSHVDALDTQAYLPLLALRFIRTEVVAHQDSITVPGSGDEAV